MAVYKGSTKITGGAGVGHVIQDDGTNVTQRNKLNFQSPITVSDDSEGDATVIDVTLTAADVPNITLSKVTDVTATVTEVNVLDGVTATTSEINTLDGVTATTAEINYLDNDDLTASDLDKLADITATAAEINILNGVTVTTDEVNVLDGITATTDEINYLDNDNLTADDITKLAAIDATASEINTLDGITSTTEELNILDGVTATTAEINVLDGLTATTTELNVLDGVVVIASEINKLAFLSGNLITSSGENIAGSPNSNSRLGWDATNGNVEWVDQDEQDDLTLNDLNVTDIYDNDGSIRFLTMAGNSNTARLIVREPLNVTLTSVAGPSNQTIGNLYYQVDNHFIQGIGFRVFTGSTNNFQYLLDEQMLGGDSYTGASISLNYDELDDADVPSLDVTLHSKTSASENATDGHVLTANGSGGVAWEEAAVPAATSSKLGTVIVETDSDIDVDSDGKLTLGNLSANKITSDTLDIDRIPTLTAAKIPTVEATSKISSAVSGVNATDGQVLTADGSGGVAWEASSGGSGGETIGTWTPSWTSFTPTNDGDTISSSMNYLKRGSLVYCYGSAVFPDSTDSWEPSIALSSLPFDYVHGSITGNVNGFSNTHSSGAAAPNNTLSSNAWFAADLNNVRIRSDNSSDPAADYEALSSSRMFFAFQYITDE